MATLLSPTARTRIRRHSERSRSDRAELLEILTASMVCHLGLVMDGHPVVLPTVFGLDPAGPDQDGTLYLHGSVAARSLVTAPESDLCVTCTLVDALILARSGFHHSMNYRSAVVMGRGRLVQGEEEKRHALDLVVDHIVPGRSRTLRPYSRKELVATTVVALPLHEASVKVRTGGVSDDEPDVAAGVWAGVVPLRLSAGAVMTDELSAELDVPAEVAARAQLLR